MDGHAVLDRIEVAAALDEDVLAEVTFAVREGDGDYVPIGTDDNAPYRVFFDASDVPEDTTLSFRAIVNDLSGHLAADQVVNVGVEFAEPSGPETPYALIHYQRPAGDYGDHTTGNSNDFWGLHLWGNAIDPAEATDWTSPKPFLGEDEYGRFAWVRLADDYATGELHRPSRRYEGPGRQPRSELRSRRRRRRSGSGRATSRSTRRRRRRRATRPCTTSAPTART